VSFRIRELPALFAFVCIGRESTSLARLGRASRAIMFAVERGDRTRTGTPTGGNLAVHPALLSRTGGNPAVQLDLIHAGSVSKVYVVADFQQQPWSWAIVSNHAGGMQRSHTSIHHCVLSYQWVGELAGCVFHEVVLAANVNQAFLRCRDLTEAVTCAAKCWWLKLALCSAFAFEVARRRGKVVSKHEFSLILCLTEGLLKLVLDPGD